MMGMLFQTIIFAIFPSDELFGSAPAFFNITPYTLSRKLDNLNLGPLELWSSFSFPCFTHNSNLTSDY